MKLLYKMPYNHKGKSQGKLPTEGIFHHEFQWLFCTACFMYFALKFRWDKKSSPAGLILEFEMPVDQKSITTNL